MKPSTKQLVFTALFAALSCVATMVIKLPTPTMGYIHPGDAIVLLSGLLLGPFYGALAGGIGSMFADIFSGYLDYAIATLIIKGAVAAVAAHVYRAILHLLVSTTNGKAGKGQIVGSAAIASVCGEAIMVLGYFVFEIFLLAIATGGGLTTATITAGIASSASGIPFNVVQGIFGGIAASILLPLLDKPFKKILNQ